jgi:hypothetical protein
MRVVCEKHDYPDSEHTSQSFRVWPASVDLGRRRNFSGDSEHEVNASW